MSLCLCLNTSQISFGEMSSKFGSFSHAKPYFNPCCELKLRKSGGKCFDMSCKWRIDYFAS